MERLFLIGQYQLHLNDIGYTYVIHHTYHTLGSLIPNVWYVLYSCMVVFLHPMWYCPRGKNAAPLHPEKRTGHHNRCGLPLFRHTETQVYRCSAYHICWWLSTRWTWLISVKMYTTRLLPTTRRCRRHWISRTWCLSQSAPRMATTWWTRAIRLLGMM